MESFHFPFGGHVTKGLVESSPSRKRKPWNRRGNVASSLDRHLEAPLGGEKGISRRKKRFSPVCLGINWNSRRGSVSKRSRFTLRLASRVLFLVRRTDTKPLEPPFRRRKLKRRPITVAAVSSSASLQFLLLFFFSALEIRIYLHHERLKPSLEPNSSFKDGDKRNCKRNWTLGACFERESI